MHVKNNNDMIQEPRTGFFRNGKKDGERDEYTFNMWKSELQNNLPPFWESMTKKHGK